ncbi:helix-turn-helix domain-containing protein [Prevotella sp. 10(H)]|uniref:helix-turn-helix domain-containing protein n=1 Tax=Prevotella sp. 10(H) TaxID=1158294 RepID=UPI00068C5EF4|nr:helix-turn-helix transcriptional regulator [Prevotella sp. 10(H)]
MKRKKIIHQGRNVKIVRESKGLYQKDLGYKINKEQSDISKIENKEIIEEDLLEQIALALEVPVEFLKNFDLEGATKAYYNTTTVNSENSRDMVNNQGTIFYPVDELTSLSEKFLNMQKEHYEKEQMLANNFHQKEIELSTEIALLKQELNLLKNKK